jgi:hypothetical protein
LIIFSPSAPKALPCHPYCPSITVLNPFPLKVLAKITVGLSFSDLAIFKA